MRQSHHLFDVSQRVPVTAKFVMRIQVEFEGVFVSRVLNWLDRQRQRRHLSQLDERLLADIGVSKSAVDEEIRRWS